MTVQTEVTLKNIRYVSDLGSHMIAARVGFEKKLDFALFRLSLKKIGYVQKVRFWATCCVNVA